MIFSNQLHRMREMLIEICCDVTSERQRANLASIQASRLAAEANELARVAESLRRELAAEKANHEDTCRQWVTTTGNLRLTADELESTKQQLAVEREAHTATKLAWKEVRELGETRENVEVLRRELAAEREAHENLKTKDCRWSEYADEQQERLRHLKEQLASALDKLDKLTRTIDCGCGEPMALAWYCSECGYSVHVNIESLQALEESEGGDG